MKQVQQQEEIPVKQILQRDTKKTGRLELNNE